MEGAIPPDQASQEHGPQDPGGQKAGSRSTWWGALMQRGAPLGRSREPRKLEQGEGELQSHGVDGWGQITRRGARWVLSILNTETPPGWWHPCQSPGPSTTSWPAALCPGNLERPVLTICGLVLQPSPGQDGRVWDVIWDVGAGRTGSHTGGTRVSCSYWVLNPGVPKAAGSSAPAEPLLEKALGSPSRSQLGPPLELL